MIELKNIHKSFDNHIVLENISLQFEKSKISMLLGPSGCGKSTMLKLINHLLSPDSGSVIIDGVNIKNIDKELLRRNMGYAIQGIGLFPHMQVRDNISVVPKLLKWPKEKINTRVDEMLELVGLPKHYDKKYPHQLSGGEAQRVGVARALAADPDILLMDEPFGALDPINRARLQQEFINIQQKLNKTVIFVTHDVGEAVRMGDYIVILQEGKVIAQGDPLSIVNEAENVAKVFLGNSYTLELLEKYTIGMYESPLKKLKSLHEKDTQQGNYSEDIGERDIFNDTTTLRELVSAMLMSKKSHVTVTINNALYTIDFDTLVHLFGGELI